MSRCIGCPVPHEVNDGRLLCFEVTQCCNQLAHLRAEEAFDESLRVTRERDTCDADADGLERHDGA